MQETATLIAQSLGREKLAENVDYLSYTDAYQKFVGVDPLHCDLDVLKEAVRTDDQLQTSLGDDRNAWLDLVMTEVIAPEFADEQLTILHHYPASQAALSRRCPENDSLADRFEVFFAEVELANGFVELTDADEQLARFTRDREIRSDRGHTVPEADDSLIAALRNGMPPCAGVAVGFERMLMIKTDSNDIRDVMSFAIEARNND